MSNLLQLLSNYYKSVLESERIYYENVSRSQIDIVTNSSSSTAPKIVNETLLLQRQLSELTTQLHDLKRQNETLKEQQKSYKALNETKITKFKTVIDNMKKNQKHYYDDDIDNKSTEKFNYHLLSPVAKRGLKRGLKISNGNSKSKQTTIFDSKKKNSTDDELVSEEEEDELETNNTANHHSENNEESFIQSLKIKVQRDRPQDLHEKQSTEVDRKNIESMKNNILDDLDIPSINEFSKDEDDIESDSRSNIAENIPNKKQIRPQKKRKLTKKKIKKITARDDGNDSLNRDSFDKDSFHE